MLARSVDARFADAGRLHEQLLGYFYATGERFGANKLHVTEARDTEYSYSDTTPIFVQTATAADLTHRIGRAWDIVTRGQYVNLAYRGTIAAGSDHVQMVGAGTGYRMGRILRIGFDADYFKRTTSGTSAQAYKGLRAGLSLSYGLPQ